MRVILAMQEAHDASAAIMVDGEIVASVQEERYSGLKGDYGFPKNSVEYCLKAAGVNSSQIDEVALASHTWNPVLTKIKRNANFSVKHWVREQEEFWKPTLFEGKKINYYQLFKNEPGFDYDSTYPMDHLLEGYMDAREMKEMQRIRIDTVSKLLNIKQEKIRTITHEDCHRFYSYFGSPLRNKVLALTSEGIGDYSNGTVSEFDSVNGRKELSHTRENHLGHIYQYITLLLGMKPIQHEYKVMGLAPYANIKETEKSYQVFKDVLKADGLNVVFNKRPKDLYFHFREAFEGHRFDGIAGGAQKFLEEILCKWVENCVRETGLKTICFSGGVAQNIKACKTIMELPEVDSMYVCPAAGDTSLPIGACYFAMWEYLTSNGGKPNSIQPLHNIYLGPEFSDEEIAEFLEKDETKKRYKLQKGVSPEEIAQLLSDGNILGRSAGRMEFGLRALGNRSILADPRNPETVRKINSAIKFRDFWMPFTPSILAEREEHYIVNPKKLLSPYMSMAFDSTELARKDLIASLHPADLTMRPQILEEKRNPEYYAILKAFEKLTGVGGLLNTSFNLHGLPIALGPKEAVFTLDNSDLDGLILGNFLILRK